MYAAVSAKRTPQAVRERLVSQRYVHPTPETMENAFVALELATHEAEQNAAQESAGVATIPATVEGPVREVIH
jgi:hypothetical protein